MLIKKTKYIILLLSLIVNYPAFSQLDYDVFEESYTINSNDSHKVMLNIYNLDFVKNNEYFSDMVDGYTLYGYQLHPKIVYYPNSNLRLNGGIFLLREYGYSSFTQAIPTFTLKIEKNGFGLVFGNLESTLNHRMIEPLFDFESVFTKKMEHGSQIIINKRKFWFDGWLNWEKATYKRAPFQEQLTIAMSSKTTIFQPNEKIKISIPIQALIHHKGGQIDIVDDPLLTLFNVAAGISIHFKFQKSNFINGFIADNYVAYYKDLSFDKKQVYKEGHGVYLNYLLKTKYNFNIGINYWKGNKFIGPKGTALYQSVSSKTENYSEADRNIFYIKLIYEHEFLKNLYLSTRFEPYYDINNKLLEYSYGIYVVYSTDIFLIKTQ